MIYVLAILVVKLPREGYKLKLNMVTFGVINFEMKNCHVNSFLTDRTALNEMMTRSGKLVNFYFQKIILRVLFATQFLKKITCLFCKNRTIFFVRSPTYMPFQEKWLKHYFFILSKKKCHTFFECFHGYFSTVCSSQQRLVQG